MATLLAAAVDSTEDCPDEDNEYSAMLMGQIVAGSALEPGDLNLMAMFMEIAYKDESTAYHKGLQMSKKEKKALVETSSSGGRVPSKAEAAEIEREKGMPWQAALSISCILVTGSMATDGELEREGWGSDPTKWSSAKEQRKRGKKFLDGL